MNLHVLFQLNYGLYIVTAKEQEKFSGCVVNTVTQITAEEKPKLIVAINKQNYTCEIAQTSQKMNISILSKSSNMLQIGKFGFQSGKNINKLEGTQYIIGKNGIPVITENVTGYIECDILEKIDCVTHILFILEMQQGEVVSQEEPMTYEYYHKVIKGKTPPKASTYQK